MGQRKQQPRSISPRTALKGHGWAVVFDFGGHVEVYDTYLTSIGAEKKAKWLNGCGASPSGAPYEVARIDYGSRG